MCASSPSDISSAPAGAAGAAVLPARVEHEVADDELPPAVEQVQQGGGAVGPLEHVVLLDLHHRQPATVGGEHVPGPGQLLLLGQQLLPGGQPLVVRNDLRQAHRALLSMAYQLRLMPAPRTHRRPPTVPSQPRAVTASTKRRYPSSSASCSSPYGLHRLTRGGHRLGGGSEIRVERPGGGEDAGAEGGRGRRRRHHRRRRARWPGCAFHTGLPLPPPDTAMGGSAGAPSPASRS